MRLKQLIVIGLFFLFATTISPAFSAEASGETDTSPSTTEESSEGTTVSENAPAGATDPTAEELSTADEDPSPPTEDTFIPRTQISEDLSVSFPVNI